MDFITYESVKALEINISMLFNLVFANNTNLACFFFLYLIIDLCFSIAAGIAQIFNPTAEVVIFIGIPTKEAKVVLGTNLVTAEA